MPSPCNRKRGQVSFIAQTRGAVETGEIAELSVESSWSDVVTVETGQCIAGSSMFEEEDTLQKQHNYLFSSVGWVRDPKFSITVKVL